jgi:thiol-disulfide isomerase/thioredoxin
MRWGCTVALLVVLVLAKAGSSAPEGIRLGEFVPTSPPQPAPEVFFADPAGNPVSLSDFKGKFLLVNLWATWCAPCLREMPSLERLQATLGDRITVAAISEDRGGGKAVEPFITKLGLKSVKVYLDPKSAVGQAFKVQGLPTSLLLDRENRVLGRVEGAAEWDSSEILAILRSLLDGDGVIKASSPALP